MQKNYKFAIAHSDPGSVNAINGLLAFLKDSQLNFECTVFHYSKNNYFVDDCKYSLESLLEYFNKQSFDFLFAGSSVESSLEFFLFGEAAKKQIPSMGIVDHWVNYRLRFEREQVLHFPDFILVNDHFARAQAISEHVPEEKLKVLGNPWWYNLEKAKKGSKKPGEDSLLFLSDNLYETWGSETKNKLGYNEFEILEDLIQTIDDFNKTQKLNKHITIRLHPKEEHSKYDRYLKKNVIDLSDNLIPLSEELKNHSYIVGMFSNALIEASFFQSNIVRYEPRRILNLLPTSGIEEIFSKRDLLQWLSSENRKIPQEAHFKFKGNDFLEMIKKRLS